jgi:F420 biosynthesis protein FbiB-like protein
MNMNDIDGEGFWDFLALLASRQSIRRFLSRPVPKEKLDRVLEAAVRAPSAHNRQPWRFAVLQTPESRVRLAGAMGADFRRDLTSDGVPLVQVEAQVRRSYQRIVEAPVAILLCMDLTEMDAYPDPIRRQAEYIMGVQSVAMAGENLLLAAHAQGLGGVWVCAPIFTPDTARSALELPEAWQPQGLLLLGYPERAPEPRTRKELAEVTRYL